MNTVIVMPSKRTQRIMNLALCEAARLGHDHVEVGHVLLAILTESKKNKPATQSKLKEALVELMPAKKRSTRESPLDWSGQLQIVVTLAAAKAGEMHSKNVSAAHLFWAMIRAEDPLVMTALQTCGMCATRAEDLAEDLLERYTKKACAEE